VTRPGGDHDVPWVAAELRLVVGRLARKLRDHAPSGLTPTQLSALANIDEFGPLRLTALAAREAIAPPTASRAVDGLVGQGLVTREPDPEDARSTILRVSPQGDEFLAGWRQSRDALLASRLAALDPSDISRLAETLPLLRALLDSLTAEAPAEPPE
jgi:DNA-binding MarR family transcriptional regulator